MKIDTLRRVRCPAAGCAGRLEVSDRVDELRLDSDEQDLIEAVLVCQSCGAEYPIVLGAALLVPDLDSYLYLFWREIERCSRQLRRTGISLPMRRYLGVASAFTGQAEPYLSENLDWSTSPYVQAHFDPDSYLDDLPEGWWRGALEEFRSSEDPYGYLAEQAAANRDGGGLLVEVGSNVGRMAAGLASGYEFVVGVDWSFNAVFAARRLLVASPEPMQDYPLEIEKGEVEVRQLPSTPTTANLDFLVADGAALPFPDRSVSTVAALNVLCAVPSPDRLFGELSRVLGPGALLLLSSPYWSDDEATGWRPAQMRAALARGFAVLEEKDMVPWALRLAKRRWNVYLCHCIVATRID